MQSVRQKERKKRELPPQSEIAQIAYQSVKFERTVEKTIEKRPLFGKVTKELVTETVKKEGYRFHAQAVGPQGRYVAGVSPEFEAQTEEIYRTLTPLGEHIFRNPQGYIVRNPDSEAALNALLSKLWSEGWQPTSWGQFWYDFRLRRVVLNSERSSPRVSSPREPSEATER